MKHWLLALANNPHTERCKNVLGIMGWLITLWDETMNFKETCAGTQKLNKIGEDYGWYYSNLSSSVIYVNGCPSLVCAAKTSRDVLPASFSSSIPHGTWAEGLWLLGFGYKWLQWLLCGKWSGILTPYQGWHRATVYNGSAPQQPWGDTEWAPCFPSSPADGSGRHEAHAHMH